MCGCCSNVSQNSSSRHPPPSRYLSPCTPHRRTTAPPRRRTAAPLHRCLLDLACQCDSAQHATPNYLWSRQVARLDTHLKNRQAAAVVTSLNSAASEVLVSDVTTAMGAVEAASAVLAPTADPP